jgi:hypothetical protein
MNKKQITDFSASSTNSRIQEILDNFNFKLVHKAMNDMGWTWDFGKDAYVPSIDYLKITARKLLEQALQDGFGVATGGFEVEYSPGNLIYLKFVLEEWSA